MVSGNRSVYDGVEKLRDKRSPVVTWKREESGGEWCDGGVGPPTVGLHSRMIAAPRFASFTMLGRYVLSSVSLAMVCWTIRLRSPGRRGVVRECTSWASRIVRMAGNGPIYIDDVSSAHLMMPWVKS